MAARILVMVGGISKNSLNEKLYGAIQNAHGKDFTFEDYDIKSLPFFSQDLEADPPSIVTDFRKLIRSSEGVLIITPEYNRSFPAVIKNALDWGSRPYGQSVWNHKPAGVIGASVGAIGTFGAQHHLRQVLAYLNMPTLGQPEMYINAGKSFDPKGKLVDTPLQDHLAQYMKTFGQWVSQHRQPSTNA
ncbi:MAG: NAD(P)H-dependent oxidoreductase [Bdellovibrionaceae bacterium]|nr:NAD(P)H-dependent oxidoreductase [Bdellovibrio sp.]